MRTYLQQWLPLLILLGLAGSALADISPDVEVRLTSPFITVNSGDTYQGSLEIVIRQDGVLSDFAIAGTGWTATLDRAPAPGSVRAGDVLTAEFSATALDPQNQLEFSCDFSGFVIRHGFDFSERNVRNLTEGGPVREISTILAIPGNPAWDEADDLLGPRQSDPPRDDRRTITVSGRFGTLLTNGSFFPAHSIRIEVWDDDGITGDDLMGSGSTNYDGYYSLNVDSSDGDVLGDPDIYVKFILTNNRVYVYEPTSGDTYFYYTGVHENFGGTELDLGTLIPSDSGQHASIFLHTQATRAWVSDYLLGYDVPGCRVEWPSAAWPNCNGSGRIQMRSDFSWRDGVVWHEYGHWFDHEMASWEPWDYCNGVCDNSATDCGHCFWCEESQVIAWLEGWAQFHGWSVSDWSEGYYGFAPLSPVDAENINTCGGSYDESLLTEGFIAALAQDMADNSQDSHGAFGDYTDRMSGGVGRVFATNAAENPTGSQDFADKYVARYPADREIFWETSANCGFWFDTTAPGVVTSLISTSHTAGVPSPDPTVTFSWVRAADNYSGTAGYGLAISAGVSFPSAVQDIGNVTTYTTDPLSPGTYYFSIRAVDNAGYWSGGYAWWGPIVIREPDPADLTNFQATGWAYPLVPRTTNDTTTGYAPMPATLPGDATGTFWNIFGRNQGEAATGNGFWGWLNVDGDYTQNVYWGVVNAGQGYYGPNRGPVFVQAGRHSFTFRHDATDLVAEVDELNNIFGRQFIWTVPTLDALQALTRTSPPPPTGGWDEITSGSAWYNCDGLSMPTNYGWWHAMAVWSDSDLNDFDCRLHTTSTGAEDGFGASLAYSARGAGYLDVVIANRNLDSAPSWDVGVPIWAGSGDYHAYHAASSTMAFGDSLSLALGDGIPILLREFYLGVDNAGPVSITVSSDPGAGPLNVVLMDRSYVHGTLYNGGILGSQSLGAAGVARISTVLETPGWYGIAVYRDQAYGLEARDFALEVSITPPDLAAWTPSGWHSPLTPRPAEDGTATWCPQPDTLYSYPGETYFNNAAGNLGPVPSLLPAAIMFDDQLSASMYWPTMPAETNGTFNWPFAVNLQAGRHTLAMKVDLENVVEETNETNNIHGEQWIWSPVRMVPSDAIVRSAPPAASAGWGDITVNEPVYYNCDGLRLVRPNSQYWGAMAILPGSDSDFDLRLHEGGVGAKSGFGSSLTGSYYGGSALDYLLVDFNTTDFRDFDVGVIRYGGTGFYRAHAAQSDYLGYDPVGTWGPFAVPANGIVSMTEFGFVPESYHLVLENLSGVDLGVAVHAAGTAYQNRNNAIAVANSGAAGENEVLDLELVDDGYYCIVVYRLTEGGGAAQYNLTITSGVISAAEDDQSGLPRSTRLTGVWPNPFNPQTTVSFDLARDEPVRLDIFDLQGRQIRRLVDTRLGAGHHEVVWRGRDDAGRRVASGVYFARLQAASGQGLTKVVLVK